LQFDSKIYRILIFNPISEGILASIGYQLDFIRTSIKSLLSKEKTNKLAARKDLKAPRVKNKKQDNLTILNI
jgi:hypothetical protein